MKSLAAYSFGAARDITRRRAAAQTEAARRLVRDPESAGPFRAPQRCNLRVA